MSNAIFDRHFNAADVQVTIRIGASNRGDVLEALKYIDNRIKAGPACAVPVSAPVAVNVEIDAPDGMFSDTGFEKQEL